MWTMWSKERRETSFFLYQFCHWVIPRCLHWKLHICILRRLRVHTLRSCWIKTIWGDDTCVRDEFGGFCDVLGTSTLLTYCSISNILENWKEVWKIPSALFLIYVFRFLYDFQTWRFLCFWFVFEQWMLQLLSLVFRMVDAEKIIQRLHMEIAKHVLQNDASFFKYFVSNNCNVVYTFKFHCFFFQIRV